MQGQKQHRSEAEEWLFRLAKDPKQYEKIFIDSINTMNYLIKEFEKIQENTPATDHLLHAIMIAIT